MKGLIRPFRDRLDIEIPYIWYPVADTAPEGPTTVFVDRFWDDREHWLPPGVGVVPFSQKPYFGPIPTREVGPLIGTADQWVNGFSYADYVAGKYPVGPRCVRVPHGVTVVRVRQAQAIGLPRGMKVSVQQAQTVRADPVAGLAVRQAHQVVTSPFGVDLVQQAHQVVTSPFGVDLVQQAQTVRADPVRGLVIAQAQQVVTSPRVGLVVAQAHDVPSVSWSAERIGQAHDVPFEGVVGHPIYACPLPWPATLQATVSGSTNGDGVYPLIWNSAAVPPSWEYVGPIGLCVAPVRHMWLAAATGPDRLELWLGRIVGSDAAAPAVMIGCKPVTAFFSPGFAWCADTGTASFISVTP